MQTIQNAERFEDLLNLESHDLPYLFDEIFIREDAETTSLSERRFKLLKSLDRELRQMLHKEEKVYFISSGIQTSLIEEYFIGGLYAFSINGRAIILTTQRIILWQTSGIIRAPLVLPSFLKVDEIKPLALKFQIHYTAIEKISRTHLGNCRIKLKNGKTLVFAYLPKKDCIFMEKEIKDRQNIHSFSLSEGKGLESLCPYCYNPVEGFPERCPYCSKSFKSASRAGWLSFIFPGLGDLYLGNRYFAALKIIVAVVFWIAVLSGAAFENLYLFLPKVDTSIILFLCMHGLSAIWTNHIAKKGIYPAEK